jgi:two-component system, NtrC family, response regulator GlrR
MGSLKLLLLNLNSPDDRVKDLKEILAPCLQVEELNLQMRNNDRDRHLEIIRKCEPALILLMHQPTMVQEARDLLQSMRKEFPAIPAVVVVDTGEPDEMFAWLKLGAVDFMAWPFRAVDILPRVWRLLERTDQRETLAQSSIAKHVMKELIGKNEKFLQAIEKIPRLTECEESVLISGETGTGKELCARAIHYLSPRARKPFIPVNCGAIPADLVENELFGHERGAFTSAKTAQPGLIQEAEGGTLFLDELDCLPLLAQVKLLRFLQEREFRSLGSTKMRKANIRIIAATNINCEEAVKNGQLRRDLYYRLNVIPLALPPLRERGEDILLLARYFLDKQAIQFNKQIIGFSPNAIRKLYFYQWPGNVRELEHIIMRAVILSGQSVIRAGDISLLDPGHSATESFQEAKNKIVAEFEKTYIRALLLDCHGNITEAARLARKNRRAFWELIRKHHISVESLRSSIALQTRR